MNAKKLINSLHKITGTRKIVQQKLQYFNFYSKAQSTPIKQSSYQEGEGIYYILYYHNKI